MSEIIENVLHGLGRRITVKASEEKHIKQVYDFVESFEYETQTNQQLATKLIKLIEDGVATVGVLLNLDEMSNIENLIIEDKLDDATALEKSYRSDWQRVLKPIAKS